jgi:hypothetical protein
MLFVLAVGGIFVFACIAHARHTATMRALRDAQRTGGSQPPSSDGTGSSDLFGASSFGSSQPDEHAIAHAKAHYNLDSHGESLMRHHGMDGHTASIHSSTGSGISGTGHDT